MAAEDLGKDYDDFITTAEIYHAAKHPQTFKVLDKALGRGKGPTFVIKDRARERPRTGAVAAQCAASEQMKWWGMLVARLALLEKLMGRPPCGQRFKIIKQHYDDMDAMTVLDEDMGE